MYFVITIGEPNVNYFPIVVKSGLFFKIKWNNDSSLYDKVIKKS